MTEGMTRRSALTGAAAVGAGLPVLAACAGGDDSSATEPPPKAGQTLGASADVPVGGGKIYPDERVVVTQPAGGDFKGFSAVCPHQGCLVATVSDGTINCACHGSKFSIEDGSVVNGPATSGLPDVAVKVDGSSITTG